MKNTFKAYILSSFTAQSVEEYLKRSIERFGSNIEIEFGPYFQIMQELCNDGSDIFVSDCKYVILWMRFVEFYESSLRNGTINTEILLSDWDEYVELIINAAKKTNKKFIVVMPSMMLTLPLGKGDVNTNYSITYLQEQARCLMMKKLCVLNNVLICDEEQFFYLCGRKEALSPALYAMAKIPYTEIVFEEAGRCLAEIIGMNKIEPEICIDLAMLLDEEYTEHIPTEGISKQFDITSDDFMHDLQNRFQMLLNWGKHIRLCTSLSEEELKEILQKDNVFLSEAFQNYAITSVECLKDAVEKIHEKQSDAKIICIALNGVVEVSKATMLYLSEGEQDWVGFLLNSGLLDAVPIVTEETIDTNLCMDRKKNFFETLNVNFNMKILDADQMEDILHLVENSRDFRFSQIVNNKNDVKPILEEKNYKIIGAYISDRFGDYGLGALAVLEKKDLSLSIIDLMLSCRVLGKGIEDMFWKAILEEAEKQSCTEIKVLYRNTGRNDIAKDFLEKEFNMSIDEKCEEKIFKASLRELNEYSQLQKEEVVSGEKIANKKEQTLSYLRLRWAKYCSDDQQRINEAAHSVKTVEDIVHLVNKDTRVDWSSVCEYVAPRNETEEIMVEIWKEILHLDKVGVLDNFFAIGGTSILATQLIIKFREKFKIDLPIRLFFDKSNIKQMAEYIDAQKVDTDMEKFNESSIFDYRYTMREFLKNEIYLDESIKVNNSSALPVSECKVGFLTGATGFLGAFLLQELLDRTQMRIICLVRAEDDNAGKERIIQNLKRYLIWNEEYRSRFDAICGDLEKPLLGLSEAKFEELSLLIDVIYHNGANTNFLNPYAMLKAANVGGTEEVLRLAVRNKLKNVEYVSTHYVFSSISNEANTVIMEDQYPDENEIDIMGYQQTKMICEQKIRIARERGIPVSMYRVGRISGSSKTGACQTADFVWLMTKCCVESGIMFAEETRLELIPVDYVSSAIVAASLNPKAIGRNFHIINEGRTPIQYVTKWMDARGFKVKAYPYLTWKEKMTEIVSKDDSLKTVQTMLPFITEDTVELDKELRLDTRNIDEVLEGTGIKRMKVDRALFEKYLDYFISIGFFTLNSIRKEDINNECSRYT